MERINVNYSKDAELLDCINSVYADFQILLQGAFINISRLPNQLTIVEFISLFENYDWQDIFNLLEELENLPNSTNTESVNSSIIESLQDDCNIVPLTNPRDNTYFKVWAGLMTDKDF